MVHTRVRKFFLLGAALILVVGGGCSSKSGAAKGGKGQGQRPIPVEVKAAASQDFSQKLLISGRLEAAEQVSVTSKITGKLKEILVKVGDTVQAGQVLAKLDDQEILLQRQKAQASLAAAKAKYEDIAAPPKAETIQQSKNSLADAKTKYESAEKDFERNQALYKAGALSEKDMDSAKVQLSYAETTYNNAQQKLQLDEQGATAASINAAKAQVDQSQSDLDLLQLNAENSEIKAPITGIVATLPANLGDNVGNSTVIASVVNISKLKVKAQVSESQVGLLKPGQTAKVDVSALGQNFDGEILSVSPVADDSKSFPVEIAIPNPDLKAKAGMLATIEIQGNARKALVVPREAVIMKQDKNYLYVVDQGKAKQVEVKVGESNGEVMEILSGLTTGTQVVVAGQNTLFPDSPVSVMGQDCKKSAKTSAPKGQGNSK